MDSKCSKGLQVKQDIEILIAKKKTLSTKEYKKQLKIIRYKLIRLILSGECNSKSSIDINEMYERMILLSKNF